MKTFAIIILLTISHMTFSQDDNLDIKVTNLTSENETLVRIDVFGGTPLYTYFLYKGEPWKDGVLVEKVEKVNEATQTFPINKKDIYYIGVIDANGFSMFKKVEIE